MSLAEQTLLRLLERGERARLRGGTRAVRESFKSTDSPFWVLNLDEREALHVRMRQAAAAGAVRLRWSPVGGDDRPLEVVELLDVERLAGFLGRDLRSERAAAAAARLAAWSSAYPRVADVLDAWRALRTVRGLTPQDASDLEDALRVLAAVAGGGADRVQRVLSTQLFGDSKRIEALGRHLDVLTSDSIAAPARPVGEVFAALGLVKAALPFLACGTGTLALVGDQRCPLLTPYVGVAPEVVRGLTTDATWVLTIENLTTFHQVAALVADRRDGVVVYTGGMPSPNWCRAYRAILESLDPSVVAYHWGDVDEGGFRIAAHIRNRCAHDRVFLPWRMQIEPTTPGAVDLGASAHRSMQAAATRAGWDALAAKLTSLGIEQEALEPSLPGSHDAHPVATVCTLSQPPRRS